MVELTRRAFFGGGLALVGVMSVPSVLRAIPTIYGDGVHDDSAGFDAALRGLPVNIQAEAVAIEQGGGVIVTRGKYLFLRDLVVRAHCSLEINALDDSKFENGEALELVFGPDAGIVCKDHSNLVMIGTWLKPYGQRFMRKPYMYVEPQSSVGAVSPVGTNNERY